MRTLQIRTVVRAATWMAATCVAGALVLLTAGHILVVRAADGKTYSDVTTIPARRAGLVLGCSRLLPDGRRNLFYDNRMAAAAQLFFAHKVEYLIVSGDNHRREYDEPKDMKDALIAAGVPADHIYCDYAGFRTLDSIMRVRDVFGQRDVVIVSQAFHNDRAIFIAQHAGVNAIGFNAPEVDAYNSFGTKCREVFARGDMLIDLYVRRRGPRFGGEPVHLPG